MIVVQSPMELPVKWDQTGAFLAGGISECPNWQQEFIDKLAAYNPADSLVIYNPRREEGLSKDGDQAKIQIFWEANYLRKCTHLVFWFPKETLCPITLFELGKYAQAKTNYTGDLKRFLTVGVHPEYQRKFDVEVQLGLIDQSVIVNYSLDDTIQNFAHKMGLKKG